MPLNKVKHGLQLKPCPFCGSDNVQVVIGGDEFNNAEFRVTCWGCYSAGPESFVSLSEAVEKWNGRSNSISKGVIDILRRLQSNGIHEIVNRLRLDDVDRCGLSDYLASLHRDANQIWNEMLDEVPEGERNAAE